MHVAGSVAMPFQSPEQFADGPIVRDGIRYGDDGLEPEDAVVVAVHHCALIWPLPPRVLHVVLALAVGLPDVNFDVSYRLAIGILDTAQDQARLAFRVVSNLGAIRLGLGFVRMEGPEDCAFGA